ncbi:hypothetical protein [Isobaculum melis]|uniref:Uncharacterized protein n=1 Tax=Isobaculum melis TaxID=142588 RepID=A0A1H9SP67_9LACT|nr:hypothetical protein [Isobaculum melis]SER86668.1 hypothetical protein SAMN04488559_10863 [Isobaculum melis]
MYLTLYDFYEHYWWAMTSIFILIGLLITINFFKVQLFRKKTLFKEKMFDLVGSFILLLILGCANFFTAILYDEFNLPTDDILLLLSGYAVCVFIAQIVVTVRDT